MAQMSVEEILMTYLPLEEDARELVDLYYRVSVAISDELLKIIRLLIMRLPPGRSSFPVGFKGH
jgi:hypothetical protein